MFLRRNVSRLTEVLKDWDVEIGDTDISNALKNIVVIFTTKLVSEVLEEFVEEYLIPSKEDSVGEEIFILFREKLNGLHGMIEKAKTGTSPVDYNRSWTLRVIDFSHQLIEVNITDLFANASAQS